MSPMLLLLAGALLIVVAGTLALSVVGALSVERAAVGRSVALVHALDAAPWALAPVARLARDPRTETS